MTKDTNENVEKQVYEEQVLTEIEIQQNVVKNLNYFKYKYSKDIDSQKVLANLLGVKPSQLTKILKGEQTPTVYPFLTNVKKWFHCSIDDFLYTDIQEMEKKREGYNENLPEGDYKKFVGLYQMYYFDTSAFKGRERASTAKALKSGVMYVEKNEKSERYHVMAVFGMKKENADTSYKELFNEYKNYSSSYIHRHFYDMSKSQHVYYGDLELSKQNVYISLSFENTKDRVQMVFLRPESTYHKYIGGLGAMVSTSKGRNSLPCLQYIALADTSLYVSEEELAEHLLMHYPNLKTYDSIDHLVEFTVKLYSENENGFNRYSRLTDGQKKTLVREQMDEIVNETVEKNLFRTVVVSDIDDNEFYHYLKRVKQNMGEEVK